MQEQQTFTIEELATEKARLLAEYKTHGEKLEYAENDFDEGLINDEREKLSIRIKAIGTKIREMQAEQA